MHIWKPEAGTFTVTVIGIYQNQFISPEYIGGPFAHFLIVLVEPNE